VLRKAHEDSYKKGLAGTDDATLVERSGGAVRVIMAVMRTSRSRLPRTRPCRGDPEGAMTMRIGMGYDVHRLVEGGSCHRGVEIPWERGLLGHSDADVLLHALCDAMLGAAGMGDLGKHFPDTDARYKGISSVALLDEVHGLLSDGVPGEQYRCHDRRRAAEDGASHTCHGRIIARTVHAAEAAVNIKATTTKGSDLPAGRRHRGLRGLHYRPAS